MRRTVLFTALAVTAALALCDAASAQQAAVKRLEWTFSAGSFENTSGKSWVEKDSNGDVVFSFRETLRNSEFIECYDSSRQLSIRLYRDKMYLRCPRLGYDQWTHFYDGSWSR